jgi:Secretion system C-terminal sorting domain
MVNVTAPAGAYAGYRDFSITNSVNGTITRNNGLLVLGDDEPGTPALSASPNIVDAGNQLVVTITGVNTHFLQGSGTSLWFEHEGANDFLFDIFPISFNIINDNTIEANMLIESGTFTSDLNIVVSNSMDGTIYKYYGFHINGVDPFSCYVVATPESEAGMCDATAEIVVQGGLAPYTYYKDGSIIPDELEENLCSGLSYMSASCQVGQVGISHLIDFIIVPTTGIYTTDNYSDSSVVDTIYNAVVYNCEIDFSAIDSVYIESVTPFNGNMVVVDWNVLHGGGSSTHIVNTYALNDLNDVSSLVLQVFCPNRSTENAFIAYDQINGQELGIADKPTEELEVSVFPNPFEESFSIVHGGKGITTIVITDIAGRLVYETVTNEQKVLIHTDDLQSGQYFVTLKNNENVGTKQLIKL